MYFFQDDAKLIEVHCSASLFLLIILLFFSCCLFSHLDLKHAQNDFCICLFFFLCNFFSEVVTQSDSSSIIFCNCYTPEIVLWSSNLRPEAANSPTSQLVEMQEHISSILTLKNIESGYGGVGLGDDENNQSLRKTKNLFMHCHRDHRSTASMHLVRWIHWQGHKLARLTHMFTLLHWILWGVSHVS